LSLQSIATELTCQELNQEATAVAIVQSVLRLSSIRVVVQLILVKAHHKLCFY